MSVKITVPATAALPDRQVPAARVTGSGGAVVLSRTGELLGGCAASDPVEATGMVALTGCWALVMPGGANPWRTGEGDWSVVALPAGAYQGVAAAVRGLVAHETAAVEHLVTRQEGALDAVRALAREVPRG